MGESISDLSLTIDGCEYLGIADFEADFSAYEKYVEDKIYNAIRLNDAGLTATIKFNKIKFYKLIGVWDWVYKYCPNRRVAHLMRCGKNDRIKRKNFYRGMHILGVLLTNK